ncbi:MAG: DUF1446 domain-containing protein [Sphingobium sp.]|nr:DUF1446 domain-containing protein [Sphingobium sp.]
MSRLNGRAIRIGAGAGFAGDRIEPAVELVERGDLDYLCFECLAERTIALAQLAAQRDPSSGYDPLLERRFRAVLPGAHANRVKIITNMGAANPMAAAKATARIARELGLKGLRVAAVLGDDVLALIEPLDLPFTDKAGSVADIRGNLISANAYLGAFPIARALSDADVVLTGRVCDPALFLAPMINEFGWSSSDWALLGRGTVIGHLLECAGQLTGGYFADPGRKDVHDLARLGFPIAEVWNDGTAVLTKVEGSGGQISVATCKEQLLYEIFDPSTYLQADVVADFSAVQFAELGPDRIGVTGGAGRGRTDTLKVSVGYRDGFIGEGQISYAGPGAVERGTLAGEIVRERLSLIGLPVRALEIGLVGVNAVNRTGQPAEPAEVRLRVAARTDDPSSAAQIGAEVEALYLNGPSGGGGVTRSVRETVAVASVLIDRHLVEPEIVVEIA